MNISVFNLMGQKIYTKHLNEKAANTLLIELKKTKRKEFISYKFATMEVA